MCNPELQEMFSAFLFSLRIVSPFFYKCGKTLQNKLWLYKIKVFLSKTPVRWTGFLTVVYSLLPDILGLEECWVRLVWGQVACVEYSILHPT